MYTVGVKYLCVVWYLLEALRSLFVSFLDPSLLGIVGNAGTLLLGGKIRPNHADVMIIPELLTLES